MGLCCCKTSQQSDQNQYKHHKNASSASGTSSVPAAINERSVSIKSQKEPLFRSDIEDSDTEEQKLIEDEKLEKEMKHSVRGGESAYGKVNPNKRNNKNKSLPDSEYNKSGLVEKESKEFNLVKAYLANKQYQLIDSIGSGSYAEVYKAYYGQKGRYVAVKVIDLQKANQNYRVNFLPTEINILRQLKHQNIIKIYEISQSANKIFMIMEFALNGTVADWLRDRGSFSEVTAWQMLKRILDAIHYMHTLEIAHRDLKLENILITEKLNPKISDFSFAIKVDQKNPLNTTFCGSLPYFAPEIMQRKPYNPFAYDIWSLGICLYVMLNDGLPFKITDERLMLEMQLSKEWDFKKRVEAKLSLEVKQMIRKMLEPDVTLRATTYSLLEDPWITTQPKPIE